MAIAIRDRARRAITAAAARLDRAASTSEWERQLKRHEKWQASAWAYHDCLDADTEILTADGWRFHYDIAPGTTVLTLDVDSGSTGWEQVKDVRRFPVVAEPMVRIVGQRHSSLSTLNHRWPVLHPYWENGEIAGRKPIWKTSATLDVHQDRIRVAAPCRDLPTEPKHADSLVEVVAWFWTEGTIRKDRAHPRVSISQSSLVNEPYVSRIRSALTALFGPETSGPMSKGRAVDDRPKWRARPLGNRGMVNFVLNTVASEVLLGCAPNKRVSYEWLRQLTQAQLELFINVSIMADGHVPTRSISQKHKDMLEPLAFACVLAGFAPRMVDESRSQRWTLRHGHHNNVTIRRPKVSQQNYTGTVWCPVTPSGTWMARRHGTMYFTGNSVGEVHYAVGQIADALARGRLFVGTRLEPNAPLIPAKDEDSGIPADVAMLATGLLERLKSPIGGQAQIIRQATAATLVAGEWYLVEAETAAAGMGWYVRTTEDVKVENGRVTVAPFGVLDPQQVSRVWVPHPRRFEAADSGMRAILDQAETVLLIDRQFRAALRSRLFAGLLLLPNTLRQGATDPGSEDAGDGEGLDDPVIEDMMLALTTAIQNEGSAAAVTPNTLWGEGDQLQYARLLDLGKQIDPELVNLRQSCLRRVAQGLDIPPEIVLGMGDVSHWQAWFIGEEFINHVTPKAEFLADAFTSVFLRPELEANGLLEWSDRLEVGLDLSVLNRRPQGDEDAKYAYEKGELSGEGLRRALSIPESDSPDDDERLLTVALTRGQITPDLAASIFTTELETGWQPPDNPGGKTTAPVNPVAPALPAGESPPVVPAVASATPPTNPVAALGGALVNVDVRLTERLFAAALVRFQRALEKAGNKARGRVTAAHRESVRDLPPEHVVRHLGPALLAAAGLDDDLLLDGALDGLRPDFDRWTDEAQLAALALALAAFRATMGDDDVEPSDTMLAEFRDRQSEDRADAWEWFLGAALIVLRDKMTTGAEIADWEIRDLVRRSLARAGGADELAPLGGFLDVMPEGMGAGVATGPLVLGLLSQLSIGATGYRWVHDGPDNPFPPHEDLDGEVGQSEDDFSPYAPGDHKGCLCHLEPLLEVVQ